jgi:uncharacterized protein DUF4384
MNALRLRAIILFVILSSLALFFSDNLAFSEEGEKKVCFRWAFGAMVGADNDRRLVAVTRDTVLKTGDQLKMLVELKERCFVYLIYHTGDGKVAMLFPYDLKQFDASLKVLKKYYIPQGNRWFELDKETGLETFYLLASVNRLVALESLYMEYIGADTKMKPGLAGEILKKIRQIKKKHRKFAASAERPIPIGGNVRGIKTGPGERPPDIDSIAGEVSSTHFYSRTFTIDHR